MAPRPVWSFRSDAWPIRGAAALASFDLLAGKSHVRRARGNCCRMYTATTRAISVSVRPQYLPDQSDPAKSEFVWAYQVRIENKGDVAVQLRSRHWKITDGLGRRQEVKGPGVGGTYQMTSDTGENFDIEIPTFSLDTPGGSRQLN